MMQGFRPLIQIDRQQSYAGHPLDQSADGFNQLDHSTHPLLGKILNTSWQLILFKITFAMRIVNNLLFGGWQNWSNRANTATKGFENE